MNLSNADFGGINKLHRIAYNEERRPIFKIPYYQRPYEWDKEHIDNLINDYMKNKTSGTSTEYFVGATVLVTNEKNELEVVDGQQRVTTMYLLNYLRFILLKSLVEYDLKSSIFLTDVSKDLGELRDVYNGLIGQIHLDDIDNMIHKIGQDLSDATTFFMNSKSVNGKDKLLQALDSYRSIMEITNKSESDIDYIEDYRRHTYKFLHNEELSICYSRESFNQKLKMALAKVVCILNADGEPLLKIDIQEIEKLKSQDEIVGQYVEAIFYEFYSVINEIKKLGVSGRDITIKSIQLIKEMVDKIEFCAVVTGNEKDAYALFESLNDRNKAVDDLDLIKNLYLRAYYNKSGDQGLALENGLREIDGVWNDSIFTKENRSIISLLGAVYLTGDTNIDEKNGLGVRKAIDTYLDEKISYSLEEVCNDIKIYKLVREIINATTKNGYNANKSLLVAENDTSLSVTYKCIYLLRALKYTNVLSGLVNIILSKYLKDKSGAINIDEFKGVFLPGLSQTCQQNNPLYNEIHKIAYDLWRISILSDNYMMPREYAISLIKEANKNSFNESTLYLNSDLLGRSRKEFDNWIRDWHYGMANKDIRIKVLFMRLFKSSYNATKRELTMNAPTAIVFTKPELAELDHLEPNDPDCHYPESAYFQPPQGKTRHEVVNGLGNFMLLDDYNNIKKSNYPLEMVIKYYDQMLNGNRHWLVDEIKEDLENRNGFEDVSGFIVPKEEFFTVRRNNLITYFKALLLADSFDSTEVNF